MASSPLTLHTDKYSPCSWRHQQWVETWKAPHSELKTEVPSITGWALSICLGSALIQLAADTFCTSIFLTIRYLNVRKISVSNAWFLSYSFISKETRASCLTHMKRVPWKTDFMNLEEAIPSLSPLSMTISAKFLYCAWVLVLKTLPNWSSFPKLFLKELPLLSVLWLWNPEAIYQPLLLTFRETWTCFQGQQSGIYKNNPAGHRQSAVSAGIKRPHC